VDINAITYILVPVRDLERVRVFYRDVLELPVVSDKPTAAEFNIGGVTLAFYECPEAVAAGETEGMYIVLSVGDLAEQHALLQSRGVQFLGGVEERGDARVADFLDPEGNRLGLSQFYDPA